LTTEDSVDGLAEGELLGGDVAVTEETEVEIDSVEVIEDDIDKDMSEEAILEDTRVSADVGAIDLGLA
jgi:hypothetical protein